MKSLYPLILFCFIGPFAFAQQNAENGQFTSQPAAEINNVIPDQMGEDDKIRYLLNYLRNLPDVVFIRNGSEYNSGKAADHLESKWKKHKKKIHTAHDFVDKLATKSKTDEPYQIRFKDGNMATCAEVLNKELTRLESSAAAKSAVKTSK